MTVDFEFRRVPAFKAVVAKWTGKWDDKRTRREFESLAAWAKKEGIRTGRWVFSSTSERRFLVGLEVRGKARGSGRYHLKSFPASRVAQVVFDPEAVSPRVVYHGITDWLRWRRKEKEIKSVGSYREIYSGNPWTDRAAWGKTSIQVTVKP